MKKNKAATLNELYKQLTPENKQKVYLFYLELLQEEQNEANKHLYYFDCLDGLLSERYLTPPEINKLITGAADPMTETQIIKVAQNYEAALYRYEKNENNEPINEVCIYDPFDM